MPEVLEPMNEHPVRFWWLKRLALGWIVFFVALVGLRLAWGWELARERQRFIETIRARGEPAVMEDFPAATVAPEDNAMLYLFAAATSWKTAPESPQAFLKRSAQIYQAFAGNNMSSALQLAEEDNADPLGWLRLARGKRVVNWRWINNGIAEWAHLPYYADRNLADGVGKLVSFHHAVGDDSGAVELIRDLQFAADAIDQGQPSFENHLKTVQVESKACDLIQQLAQNLRIEPSKGGAAINSLREMIADLLNESRHRAATKRDWMGERAELLRTTTPQWRGMTTIGDWALNPLVDRERMKFARLDDRVAEAISAKDSSGLQPEADSESWSLFSNAAHPYAGMEVSIAFQIKTSCEMETLRSVSALMLAMRLYAVDHHEALPRSLQELVPKYLDAVPRDPFALDGSPIRYKPNEHRPVIYSVGADHRDDGGSEKVLTGSSDDPWAEQDAVFPYYSSPEGDPGNVYRRQ